MGEAALRLLDPYGNVTTLVGAGNGYADGPVNIAKIHPFFITFNWNGVMYMSDHANKNVRRFYKSLGDGSWSSLVNIKGSTGSTGQTGSTGAAGAAGSIFRSGAGPTGIAGNAGDYYLNTTSGTLYT